jgi:hypothetical protein
MWFGSNPIMTELVSGAIHVLVQKDPKGHFQAFKINPKWILKQMFDKFKTEYAKHNKPKYG